MQWTTLLACLVALAGVHPAAAQSAEREGSWEARFGVVFQDSSDADFKGGTTAEFDSDTSFRFGLVYHYTDNLEFGASLGVGTTDYEAELAGDVPGEFFAVRGDLEQTTLTADATWNMLSGPFTPFVTGGIGWTWVDTNIATEPPEFGCWWDPWWGYVCADFTDTRTIDGFSYALGVGVRSDFTDTVAVLGSYRINCVEFDEAKDTTDFDGFELNVGWRFSGRTCRWPSIPALKCIASSAPRWWRRIA